MIKENQFKKKKVYIKYRSNYKEIKTKKKDTSKKSKSKKKSKDIFQNHGYKYDLGYLFI